MSTSFGQFGFNDATSGMIVRYPLSTYTPTTGWAACKTGENTATTPNTYWRAFFQFNTSSIPSYAQIDNVHFSVARARTQPIGDPDTYTIKWSIGDIIGGSLDGNVGEWDGGTEVTHLHERPLHGQQVDLTSASFPFVNRAGNTDVKVWDQSTQGPGGNPAWGFDFNKKIGVGSKCLLIVQFSIPSATVEGHGFAECSAEVTHDAGATATGEGTGELDAYAEHDAAGAAAGEGTAELAAWIERLASGTAAGEGIAELAAEITHDATGTAAGIGYVSCDPDLISGIAGTAVGIGYATLDAYVERGAAATAAGVGYATLDAIIVLSAPPLAIHSGTRAFVPADTGSRSVVTANTSTIDVSALMVSRSVVPTNTETIDLSELDSRAREPRRLTS